MCGIVGYFDKTGGAQAPVGTKLLAMLTALGGRGPDSAGVAIWGEPADGLIVRVKAGPARGAEPLGRRVLQRAGQLGRVRRTVARGPLIRFEIAKVDPAELAAALEALSPDVEVVSVGRRLEIVKQVGAPRNLEAEYGVARLTGSHGIGHTRLSTESRVDLSHSQPFWAHGTVDLAVVHNGHITNYHKLRRLYEQHGVRFYTENDSEVIGVYLAGKLREGSSWGEALEASVRDLDGSFSYVAATADAFGFAKDAYCLKPLIVAETAHAVVIANEEIAIQAALGAGYQALEPGPGTVGLWEVRCAANRPPRRRRAA
jgi:glutamate synthase domain-containing protein 1